MYDSIGSSLQKKTQIPIATIAKWGFDGCHLDKGIMVILLVGNRNI